MSGSVSVSIPSVSSVKDSTTLDVPVANNHSNETIDSKNVSSEMQIAQDDLTTPETLELVSLHLQGMHASSPKGSVYSLDVSALKQSNITFWTAKIDGRVAGMGALKQLDSQSGEIKSMRTHPHFLRRGVANAMLETIVAEARRRNMKRLSLETGSGEAFEPALTLYRRRGFANGDAFGDYKPTEFNQFLHLSLNV